MLPSEEAAGYLTGGFRSRLDPLAVDTSLKHAFAKMARQGPCVRGSHMAAVPVHKNTSCDRWTLGLSTK